MIRVTYTFKDAILQDEFDIIYLKNNLNNRCLKTNTTASFDIDTVVKIEKQIKDLTIKECKELEISFGATEELGNYIMYGALDKDGNELDLNDYIDITELVTGGKKVERNGRIFK